MDLEDQTLITSAQGGDMQAFERLVHRYDKRVLSIALSYVNDPDEAKDIYQEVFVRVYRALPKFQFRSRFSTWLYRIATNVCLTHQTRQRTHTMVSIDEEPEDDTGGKYPFVDTLADETQTDEHAINTEIATHIHAAMDALSPQQRMVFTLRHYEGYKLREIAELMDCAEGTIKKYLFTATERMRARLKDVLQ